MLNGSPQATLAEKIKITKRTIDIVTQISKLSESISMRELTFLPSI
jgi:hypothetical protein